MSKIQAYTYRDITELLNAKDRKAFELANLGDHYIQAGDYGLEILLKAGNVEIPLPLESIHSISEISEMDVSSGDIIHIMLCEINGESRIVPIDETACKCILIMSELMTIVNILLKLK